MWGQMGPCLIGCCHRDFEWYVIEMMSLIKGYILPKSSAGCIGYDGAIFCQALGFTNYAEIENTNLRGGSYVLSESSQHYLIFSGFFEDDLTEEPENDELTYLQNLQKITPKALDLYTFELQVTHDDTAAAAAFLDARINLISLIYAEAFDMDDAGQRTDIAVSHIEV